MIEKILYSRKQIAAHYGVVPETVRNWEKAKLLTVECYINGKPRYSEYSIQDLHKSKEPVTKKILEVKSGF